MKINTQILRVHVVMVLALLFFTIHKTMAAITYTWTGATSTAWNLAGNWSSSGGTYPNTNTDIVIIGTATNQPTASPGSGMSYAIGSLTLDSGATLTCSSGNLYDYGTMTLNSGSTLTTSGSGTYVEVATDLTINSGATLNLGSGLTIEIYGSLYGTGTLNAATSSTVAFGPGSAHSVAAFSFYNLEIINTATLSGNIVIAGQLSAGSVSSSCTLTPGSYNVTVGSINTSNLTLTTGTGSSTLTITGSVGWSSSTYTLNNLTVNGTSTGGFLTINGNLTGTGTYTLTAAKTLALGGDMSVSSFIANGSTNTVTLTGTSQTINGGYTFNNLVINGTGTTFAGDVTVNSDLSGTGSLSGGSNNFTVGGTFSVSNFTAGTSTVTLSGTSNLGAYTFNNLTVNGTATLTGDLVVNGNLAGTGTLDPASYNVTVGGNTTISTMTAGTGSSTTTLSGASQGVNAQTFNNLTMNCSTGTTLSGNVTVNGTLKFTKGVLDIGSYKLTIGPSGSITGFSSTCYIFTSGSGTLEMTVTSVGATFSVGDAYNPITIIPTSGTATFDVAVSDGVTDGSNSALSGHAVNVTWTITVTSGTSNVTVIPQWDAAQELSGFDRTNSFVATRTSTSSAWIPSSGQSRAAGTGPYRDTSGIFTITAGNTYYIGVGDNLSALPVTLTSFHAALENNQVGLTWATASEINNNYFGVERSVDGHSWQTIGHVEGHGNSQVQENYAFTDNLQDVVVSGVKYYRLKQVDYNGKFEYSATRAVTIGDNSVSLKTYPNPMDNVLSINWINADNGNVVLKIVNNAGSVIYTENVSGQGSRSSQVDLSGYAPGTYYLEIVSDKNVISKTIYKK